VLYAFFEDGEPGAQCFLAAGQKEQAGFLFRNARGMVELNPDVTEPGDAVSGVISTDRSSWSTTRSASAKRFLRTRPASTAASRTSPSSTSSTCRRIATC
jgi:hypothetical protein